MSYSFFMMKEAQRKKSFHTTSYPCHVQIYQSIGTKNSESFHAKWRSSQSYRVFLISLVYSLISLSIDVLNRYCHILDMFIRQRYEGRHSVESPSTSRYPKYLLHLLPSNSNTSDFAKICRIWLILNWMYYGYNHFD